MLKQEIIFTGVGQGGNNIAKEFCELDYNTFFINTSYDDLKELNIPNNAVYHIPNARGCAKNRKKAQEYAKNYYEPMIKEMFSHYPTAKVVFFIYTLGGGTGGGLTNMLIEIAHSLYPDKIFNVITVYPYEYESPMILKNASECLTELYDLYKSEAITQYYILNNNNADDFKEINEEIALNFDRIINNSDDISLEGNMDEEEREDLITTRGNAVILGFDNDDFEEGINKSIENNIFCKWNNDIETVGLILNKKFNKKNCFDVVEKHFGYFITDHTTFTDKSTLLMGVGMSFNKALIRDLKVSTKKKLEQRKTIEDDIDLDIDIDVKKEFAKKHDSVNSGNIKSNEEKEKDLKAILAKWSKR